MLYLESPAGSGSRNGFSACIKGGVPVGCRWDDQSQAEAYAHTLAAFHKAFPEIPLHVVFHTTNFRSVVGSLSRHDMLTS